MRRGLIKYDPSRCCPRVRSRFANADLAAQPKQRGIEKIILVGLVATRASNPPLASGLALAYHVTSIKDAIVVFS